MELFGDVMWLKAINGYITSITYPECVMVGELRQGLLTIAQFSRPSEPKEYVNSLWELQKNPFEGDAVNSYNDGPLENGDQMGKFYEIESSSPVANLKPGETLRHIHRTIHLQGSKAALDKILMQAFSITLTEISFD